MKKVNNNLRLAQTLKNHIKRAKSFRLTPAQAGAWVFLLAFAFLTGAALTGRDRMVAGEEEVSVAAPSDPTYLSDADRGLYAMIAQAQSQGAYSKADTLINQLSNRGLVGYVLAERYLSGQYNARAEELKAWLAHYSDQPQAPRIASLAIARGVDVTLPKTIEPLRGDGSSDHLGRSGMPDSWFTALGHWRAGDIAQAEKIFTKLSANTSLNDWQRAAAHYWAYRANERLNNDNEADEHLAQAATYTTTFYGLLAAEKIGRPNLTAEAPEVSDSLRHNPRAIRASLLAQLNRKDEAENELRLLYGAVNDAKRGGLVTLASELNMPNLQMRLSRTPGLTKSEALFAQFPAPQYMVALDPIVDSALLMAVARNESAFHEEARNGSSGAMGLMQMLPSTARVVEKRIGETLLREASAAETSGDVIRRLSNPTLSARYGAEYLRMLNKEPVINGNLIHLLIGYNAGSGTLAGWKAASKNIDDPLMFIESIPYAETRNYVMQVLAQYWTYQLTMDERPASLKDLSEGKWPVLAAANN